MSYKKSEQKSYIDCVDFEFSYYYHVPVWFAPNTNSLITSIDDDFCHFSNVETFEYFLGVIELDLKMEKIENDFVVTKVKSGNSVYYNVVTNGNFIKTKNRIIYLDIKFNSDKELILKYKKGKACNYWGGLEYIYQGYYIMYNIENFVNHIVDVYDIGEIVDFNKLHNNDQLSICLHLLNCVIEQLERTYTIIYDICGVLKDNEYLYDHVFIYHKKCFDDYGYNWCISDYYEFYKKMIYIYLNEGYVTILDIMKSLSRFQINCIDKTLKSKSIYLCNYETGFSNKYICKSGRAYIPYEYFDVTQGKKVLDNLCAQITEDIKKNFDIL